MIEIQPADPPDYVPRMVRRDRSSAMRKSEPPSTQSEVDDLNAIMAQLGCTTRYRLGVDRRLETIPPANRKEKPQ